MSNHKIQVQTKDPFLAPRFKRNTYGIVAVVVGLILAVEDFTEEDSTVLHILLELMIFVPTLFLLFLFFGNLYDRSFRYLRKTKLWLDWKYREISFTIGWAILISVVLFIILGWVSNLLPFEDDGSSFFDFTWGMWVGTLIFVGIIIPIESFEEILLKRKQLEDQNARLLRSHEMAKYQALINQINPHFLFNSLNVLSYLVHKNPHDADRFIEELSNIYRYILQLKENYLVPLKKELEFIESYIFLQKIRFQNNLNFETHIDALSMQKLIPPLTLEVLVENAIKHNEVSELHPLTIKLKSNNGHLIVENNLQARMENEISSHRIGLKNLLDKFEILGSEAPKFYAENKSFIAKVPLLESDKL